MQALRAFPAFVILVLVSAAMMLVPAIHGARLGQWAIARGFLYHAVFFAILGVILGLALMNRRPTIPARYHLMTLLLSYVLLPLVLAAPLSALLPGLGLHRAYFEMLSCLTTTGATIFDRPALLPDSLHLWRALVGWMGGLMILIASFAVLAPLNLGGFEIGREGEQRLVGRRLGSIDEASARILRVTRTIAPVYAGLTLCLAAILLVAGDTGLVALCHAMAVLSTSGISPVGGLGGDVSGRTGELAMALFFLAAVSHRGIGFDVRHLHRPKLHDPQVQLMLISVLGVTLVLFLRSFWGASEIDRQENLGAAAQAVWGSLFTILSFLTTTGFESDDWLTMQIWSNLPAPGTILLGVAAMGGGIATTAGGVKLLRIFALYRHGLREMDVLIHPNSLGRRGQGDAFVSEGGAQVAFVFLMLFLISVALTMIALAATGLAFEQSLTLAIAGLTTTGPAIRLLGDGLSYGDLSDTARMILMVAMVVGRVEALVILALFNPAFWRR